MQRTTSQPVQRLRDLSPHQWKSGLAAWLGWLFDGLDMHLYPPVALPFVAELLATEPSDPNVKFYSSWIQAAFLLGWALGGGFFGRLGDRLGRSRALILTILTYAAFTGLSFFAQTWWQLLIFRFMAALGIGGEWAVGASLLSETWPSRWRPWLAAVLQSGVNIGILLAALTVHLMADLPPRYVFLVGIAPALLTLWIRKAVPETDEWHAAREESGHAVPGIAELFRGEVLKTTLQTIVVCSLALTAHWAFMFWYLQHLRSLPDVLAWTKAEQTQFVSVAMALVMVMSIGGNFVAAALARVMGYRKSISLLCFLYFLAMMVAYSGEHDYRTQYLLLIPMGITQGVFALFTMYMPPLFPTLLRTTGAGFCYNIGRIVAAAGTVLFGQVGDYRLALLYAGALFLPAALASLTLPEPKDEQVGGDELVEPME